MSGFDSSSGSNRSQPYYPNQVALINGLKVPLFTEKPVQSNPEVAPLPPRVPELRDHDEDLTRMHQSDPEGRSSRFPDTLICPICQDPFIEATTILCGHTFCGKCIETWLMRKSICPICGSRAKKGARCYVLDQIISNHPHLPEASKAILAEVQESREALRKEQREDQGVRRRLQNFGESISRVRLGLGMKGVRGIRKKIKNTWRNWTSHPDPILNEVRQAFPENDAVGVGGVGEEERRPCPRHRHRRQKNRSYIKYLIIFLLGILIGFFIINPTVHHFYHFITYLTKAISEYQGPPCNAITADEEMPDCLI